MLAPSVHGLRAVAAVLPGQVVGGLVAVAVDAARAVVLAIAGQMASALVTTTGDGRCFRSQGHSSMPPIAAIPELPHVVSFCHEVVPNSMPIRVSCDPDLLAEPLDCFPTVSRRVASAGGQSVFGWSLWESPGVLIEAEFHAVWQQPDGAMVDIVRRIPAFGEITFIVDPTRHYLGRQVNNVRKPLTKDPRVRQLIHFHNLRFDLVNAGSRADMHQLYLPPKDRKQLEALERQLERLSKQVFR